jgi:hypothetical protein
LLANLKISSAVSSSNQEKRMRNSYRLFRRDDRGGTYYCENVATKRQESLRTKLRSEAERLVSARNEAASQPALNLQLARAYLSPHDPIQITRTWQDVMDQMSKHGLPETQERCARAFRSKGFDPIRNHRLVETTPANLFSVLHANGNTVKHYLRRVHNLACDCEYLARPIISKKLWPKIYHGINRGVTAEEHSKILAAENNTERGLYYRLLWETGAAQKDAAMLERGNIDATKDTLVYRRSKLGPRSEPARLSIGPALREVLRSLPASGPLFPSMAALSSKERAAEFSRRCRTVNVSGISLHSYRYAWAERAQSAGYPERFAQQALGHTSRAITQAYGKGAVVICPPLEEWTLSTSRRSPAAD